MRALALGLLLASLGCGNEDTFTVRTGVDAFEQVPTDQVDILFVVDNSASMRNEQQALAAGFASFARALDDADNDFHLAVIPTEQRTGAANAGVLLGDPPFLTREDNYRRAFRERAQVRLRDATTADKERGLQAAVHALAPHMQIRQNRGFLRDGANLLVVFVSDEDDCSDYGQLDGRDPTECYVDVDSLIPVDDLVARLRRYKAGRGRLQLAGIVAPFDGSCGDNATPGYRYADAVLQTGGTLDRICEDDWGEILGELGLAALGIVRQWRLSHAAYPDSIVVEVDEVPIPRDPDNGWSYDSANWILYLNGDAIPARGSEIAVYYDIAPYAERPSSEGSLPSLPGSGS